MRKDRERLLDILEAIARIERYQPLERTRFDQEELLQIWMVHHIQMIGEASRSLSEELLRRYPQIPWAQIVEMRNVLVHEYFRVDLDIVWQVIHTDLPVLKEQIETLLGELK